MISEIAMRYLLAILLPPVAVLLCGKPFLAILNLLLTLCFWIPGVVHALFVVNSHLADVPRQRAGQSDRIESEVISSSHGARSMLQPDHSST